MNMKMAWQIFVVLVYLAVLETTPPASAQKGFVARKCISAQKAFDSGNLVQAEQLWKECIKENEDSNLDTLTRSIPYRGLLVTYQKAKRFEDAIELAEQSIALLKEYLGGESLDMVRVLEQKEQLLRTLGRTTEADEVERHRDVVFDSLKFVSKNGTGVDAILQYRKQIVNLIKPNWNPAASNCRFGIELTVNSDGSKRISRFLEPNTSKQCMDECIEIVRKIQAPPFDKDLMGESINVLITSHMLEKR